MDLLRLSSLFYILPLMPLRGAERGCNGLCSGVLANHLIKRRARNFKRFCKLCLVHFAVQIALILRSEIVRFDLFSPFELALCFRNSDALALGVDPETASKDACKVEHDLSEETYSKMIAFAEKAEKEL